MSNETRRNDQGFSLLIVKKILDDFIGGCYRTAGIVFVETGDKETAHSYFRQAVKRFEKTGREKKALAECLAWIENYENG